MDRYITPCGIGKLIAYSPTSRTFGFADRSLYEIPNNSKKLVMKVENLPITKMMSEHAFTQWLRN